MIVQLKVELNYDSEVSGKPRDGLILHTHEDDPVMFYEVPTGIGITRTTRGEDAEQFPYPRIIDPELWSFAQKIASGEYPRAFASGTYRRDIYGLCISWHRF